MVGVLVRAENAINAFWERAAQSFKSPHHLFFAKPGVNEDGGAVCFEQRCVARAAGSENRYAKRDVPRPSARENLESLRILTEPQPLVKNRKSFPCTNFRSNGPILVAISAIRAQKCCHYLNLFSQIRCPKPVLERLYTLKINP